jgi:membrane-associated protease RseP (regulator of RpoE activity)
MGQEVEVQKIGSNPERSHKQAYFWRGRKKFHAFSCVGKFMPRTDPAKQTDDRPRLGVLGRNISQEDAIQSGLRSNEGVRVMEIVPDSSAVNSGLQIGDIVVQMDDIPVKNTSDMMGVIEAAPSEMPIVVVRDGKELKLRAVLDGKPVVDRSEDCGAERHMGQQGSDNPTAIIIRNLGGTTVDVFAVDEGGKREWKRTLKPKEMFSASTYAGVPWMVANLDGVCKRVYYSLKGSTVVALR